MTRQSKSAHEPRPPLRNRWGGALRDAVVIVSFSSALGLLVNLVHPEGIPYIAEKEYEILVPCPEPGGDVSAMQAGDGLISSAETFLVDARIPEEHRTWTLPGAMNVSYDYLEPTSAEIIREMVGRIARIKARRIVVFGNGEIPDTGELLGRELSGTGIRNVFFVQGGAPALRRAKGTGGDL